jgi:ubiquinone/menaquinone biosynthesis C-methylase UbiE
MRAYAHLFRNLRIASKSCRSFEKHIQHRALSQNQTDMPDWNKVASAYDVVTPFTQLFSFQCIDVLQLPETLTNERVLDIATGTGSFALALAEEIKSAKAGSILATDYNPAMIEILQSKISRELPPENQPWISCRVMDGQNLDVPSNSISHVACVFGLMFFPDHLQGLREMHRVLQPGAAAAIAVWKDMNLLHVLEHVALQSGKLTRGDQLPLPFARTVLACADEVALARDLVSAGFSERAVAFRTLTRDHLLSLDHLVQTLSVNPSFLALGLAPEDVRRHAPSHPDADGPDRFVVRGTAHIALARKSPAA